MPSTTRSGPLLAPSPKTLPEKVGPYRVIAELASGGTGTVYLTRRVMGDAGERLFVLKVLHAHLSGSQRVAELLAAEGHLAAQLRHRNLIRLRELDQWDGQCCLVLDFAEGFCLSDLLAHPQLDAITRVRVGLPIVLDALSGLHAVHSARDSQTGRPLRLTHRDVAPESVLVGLDGGGRLAHFALSQSASPTMPGVCGTPAYMSPELARGAFKVDARSDVFSMGSLLWEVLTGECLFQSQRGPEAVMREVMDAKVSPPSDRNARLPDAIDQICLRALARDPALRYADASHLREALHAAALRYDLVAPREEIARELTRLMGERIRARSAWLARAPEALGDHSAVRPIPTRKSETPLKHTQIGMSLAPSPSSAPPPEAARRAEREGERAGERSSRLRVKVTQLGIASAVPEPGPDPIEDAMPESLGERASRPGPEPGDERDIAYDEAIVIDEAFPFDDQPDTYEPALDEGAPSDEFAPYDVELDDLDEPFPALLAQPADAAFEAAERATIGAKGDSEELMPWLVDEALAAPPADPAQASLRPTGTGAALARKLRELDTPQLESTFHGPPIVWVLGAVAVLVALALLSGRYLVLPVDAAAATTESKPPAQAPVVPSASEPAPGTPDTLDTEGSIARDQTDTLELRDAPSDAASPKADPGARHSRRTPRASATSKPKTPEEPPLPGMLPDGRRALESNPY